MNEETFIFMWLAIGSLLGLIEVGIRSMNHEDHTILEKIARFLEDLMTIIVMTTLGPCGIIFFFIL